MSTLNNYEKTLLRAEQEFLTFDQEEIIRESRLRSDEHYIYVTFFYGDYRIDRQTGRIEAFLPDGTTRHGTFSEGMGIFDAICEPTPFRALSGEMVSVNYFHSTAFSGQDLYQRYAEGFSEDLPKFRAVCEKIGGKPYGNSDAGYLFEIFDFLPMALLLWEGEDGIPPAMRFLWDKNATDFIRFETMFYIIGHIVDILGEEMGLNEKQICAERTNR